MPSKSALSQPYMFNDCMEDDQFCLKIGDEEDGQADSGLALAAMESGLNLAAIGGTGALTAFAMRDTLRQQFEAMQADFDSLRDKVAKMHAAV